MQTTKGNRLFIRDHFFKFIVIGGAILSLAIYSADRAEAKQVLVMDDPNNFGVNIVKDLSGMKIVNLILCATPQELSQYFGGSKERYTSEKAKIAEERTRVMSISLLRSQIADISMSITNLAQKIESLRKTSAYLNSRRELNGLALYGIPAGGMENKQYEWASGISMKCLQKTDGSKIGIEAVGNLTSDEVSLFNDVLNEQLEILKKFDSENRDMSRKLEAEIAENGKVGKGMIMSLAQKMNGIRKVLVKNAVSMTAEEFKKYCPKENCPNSLFAINYNLDAKGAKQIHELPWYLKTMASVAGVDDKSFVDASISLGDVTYPEVWLPEQTILNGLREDTAHHIQRMTKIKSDLESVLVKLEKKLKILESK